MSPVAGRTVLVTRAAEDAAPWAERLAALGATPVVFPCLVCEILDDAATRSALAAALDGAAWLALTSRRGVEAVAALAPGGVPEGVAIAAVGPATAAAARALLGRCDLVAPAGTGASLAEALRAALAAHPPAPMRPAKVAIAAADRAVPHLERILAPVGVEVARVDVYRTVPAPPETPRVRLDALGVDTILLASPSAVAGLVHRAVVPGGAVVVTIGPSTTEAARAHGLAVLAEARRPGLEGILEVIP